MKQPVLKCFWDHSSKPSTFVITLGTEQIYKGPFEDGFKRFNLEYQKWNKTYGTYTNHTNPADRVIEK